MSQQIPDKGPQKQCQKGKTALKHNKTKNKKLKKVTFMWQLCEMIWHEHLPKNLCNLHSQKMIGWVWIWKHKSLLFSKVSLCRRLRCKDATNLPKCGPNGIIFIFHQAKISWIKYLSWKYLHQPFFTNQIKKSHFPDPKKSLDSPKVTVRTDTWAETQKEMYLPTIDFQERKC